MRSCLLSLGGGLAKAHELGVANSAHAGHVSCRQGIGRSLYRMNTEAALCGMAALSSAEAHSPLSLTTACATRRMFDNRRAGRVWRQQAQIELRGVQGGATSNAGAGLAAGGRGDEQEAQAGGHQGKAGVQVAHVLDNARLKIGAAVQLSIWPPSAASMVMNGAPESSARLSASAPGERMAAGQRQPGGFVQQHIAAQPGLRTGRAHQASVQLAAAQAGQLCVGRGFLQLQLHLGKVGVKAGDDGRQHRKHRRAHIGHPQQPALAARRRWAAPMAACRSASS